MSRLRNPAGNNKAASSGMPIAPAFLTPICTGCYACLGCRRAIFSKTYSALLRPHSTCVPEIFTSPTNVEYFHSRRSIWPSAGFPSPSTKRTAARHPFAGGSKHFPAFSRSASGYRKYALIVPLAVRSVKDSRRIGNIKVNENHPAAPSESVLCG